MNNPEAVAKADEIERAARYNAAEWQANYIRALYDALKEAGFLPDAAMQLTCAAVGRLG